MDELAKWLPIIGFAVTGFGWFVSSAQANSREARKEKRTEVDACCKLAAEILEKARKYYVKPPDDSSPGEAADLSFSVMRLLKRMERLERQQSSFKVTDAGEELFEAATGGEFESSSRAAKGPLDPQVRRIEQAVHRVIDDLESGFETAFKTWGQTYKDWTKERKRWDRNRFFPRARQ